MEDYSFDTIAIGGYGAIADLGSEHIDHSSGVCKEMIAVQPESSMKEIRQT